MDEQTISRIKRYLKKKINPKVIALELGISLEEVEKYNKELLEEERKQQEVTIPQPQITQKVNCSSSNIHNSYLKMTVLRGKYERAYRSHRENPENDVAQRSSELSEDKLQEAENLISAIEEKSARIVQVSKKEARAIAKQLIEDAKAIHLLGPLPLELAQRLRNAIAPIQIDRLSREDKLPLVIENVKRMAGEKIIQTVDVLQAQTQDIEKLKKLSLLLTSDLERKDPLTVGTLKRQIQRKIQEQQQRQAIEKIRNIPQNLSEIIESIASGEVDLQAAAKIIEEEAKTRLAGKSQKRTFMAPSEEHEKKQITMQILNAIRENPDRYQFRDPEMAIGQIQTIFGAEKGETLRSVVTNLIGRKHFGTAKRICRKFSENNKDAVVSIYVNNIFQDIKNAELANIVLDAIKTGGPIEQQASNYDAIEMRIKLDNINTSAVLLGTNFDGTKQIKLSDIWLPDGKNQIQTHR